MEGRPHSHTMDGGGGGRRAPVSVCHRFNVCLGRFRPRLQFCGYSKLSYKVKPRLRELVPAARGNQDVESRNLVFTFKLFVGYWSVFDIPWVLCSMKPFLFCGKDNVDTVPPTIISLCQKALDIMWALQILF